MWRSPSPRPSPAPRASARSWAGCASTCAGSPSTWTWQETPACPGWTWRRRSPWTYNWPPASMAFPRKRRPDRHSVHDHLSRREFGHLPGDRAHATFPRKRRHGLRFRRTARDTLERATDGEVDCVLDIGAAASSVISGSDDSPRNQGEGDSLGNRRTRNGHCRDRFSAYSRSHRVAAGVDGCRSGRNRHRRSCDVFRMGPQPTGRIPRRGGGSLGLLVQPRTLLVRPHVCSSVCTWPPRVLCRPTGRCNG